MYINTTNWMGVELAKCSQTLSGSQQQNERQAQTKIEKSLVHCKISLHQVGNQMLNKLTIQVVEYPFLEVLRAQQDKALRNWLQVTTLRRSSIKLDDLWIQLILRVYERQNDRQKHSDLQDLFQGLSINMYSLKEKDLEEQKGS